MIKKVAVIGGGPAGLCAVYQALKTQSEDYGFECVGFEGRSKLGGVWSDAPGKSLESPTVAGQLAKLQDPTIAHDTRSIFYDNSPLVNPVDGSIQLKTLSGTGIRKPLKISRRQSLRDGTCFANKTGIYSDFVSNTPKEMMDFENSSAGGFKSEIYPLVDLPSIKKTFCEFIDKNQLQSHYRMNTSVEYLDKFGPAKYVLAAKRSDPATDYDEWYLESFDAVIIANGHFSIPYIPYYMSQPKGSELASRTIHDFNRKFPGVFVHLRDIDGWYHNVLPQLHKKSQHRRLVIVGKSFSCMDLLKRIKYLQDSGPYEIIISTNQKPEPDERSPFKWFDEWLLQTDRVTLKPLIQEFELSTDLPQIKFMDGSHYKVDYVLFATGYLYSFPFVSPQLLESCRIITTPDPRNDDQQPSNISRVTGLYLHTFSIAEPTLTFSGISSNANFQSFDISAKAIVGAFTRFNKLFQLQKPVDFPYFDSIWSQILPPIREQLMWSQNRFLQAGNSAAFHYYYPLTLLLQDWLEPSKRLFPDGEQVEFPSNWRELSQDGFERLKNLFQNAMKNGSSH
ncbi:hypothetical protein ZYGR_0AG02150 [Zygosaccharomyces rouxii]|uniref:FAD/NAD(P)-binding domain-containing protein n=1 Tax=Zygosaccharomyces rouxii TaxID=4956 RepID=A0A1Q3A919_ZYGRO|nr:hypothetical protein ZYGR_0AG02150 [Zygosaccharomyces rouxii]